MHRDRDWFLHVDMEVAVHGPIGHKGMRVVGGTAEHCVESGMIQRLAPILIRGGIRILSHALGQVLLVDIANDNHVLAP